MLKCQDNIPVSQREGMVFAFPLSETGSAQQFSPRGVGEKMKCRLLSNLVLLSQGLSELLHKLAAPACVGVSILAGLPGRDSPSAAA